MRGAGVSGQCWKDLELAAWDQVQIIRCSPFFYGCDWAGIAIGEFMDILDACLRWHRDARTKGDLDYRSPRQYRRDLGLLAA